MDDDRLIDLSLVNSALIDARVTDLITDISTSNTTEAIVIRAKYFETVKNLMSKHWFKHCENEIDFPEKTTDTVIPGTSWTWYEIPNDLEGLILIRRKNYEDIYAWWVPGSKRAFNNNLVYDTRKSIAGKKYLGFPTYFQNYFIPQNFLLRYNFFQLNTQVWPETFKRAVSTELAARIYGALNEKTDEPYQNRLEKMAMVARNKSIEVDGRNYSNGMKVTDRWGDLNSRTNYTESEYDYGDFGGPDSILPSRSFS